MAMTMSAPSTHSCALSTARTSTPSRSLLRLAKSSRRSCRRLNTRASLTGRTEHTASSCVRAWNPDPMTATVFASSRAMYFVARPLAAPVRICPIRPASMHDSSCPDS